MRQASSRFSGTRWSILMTIIEQRARFRNGILTVVLALSLPLASAAQQTSAAQIGAPQPGAHETPQVSAQQASAPQTASPQAAPQTASSQGTAQSSGAPQTQSTPPALPAPRSSGPPPVGLSGQLASWLQVRGEFRGRLEGFTGGGFKPGSSDAYMLDRFRINAMVAPAKTVKFVVQMQDARAFEKNTGGQAVPFRDTLDLRLAYGEFGNARNSVRAGRQELAFGEQRLIGHLNWTNTARSFDGVHATLSRKAFKLDVLAASVVTIRQDSIGKSGNGNALYGLYGSAPALIPKAVVEPYLLWRQSTHRAVETGGTGDLHQATIGVRTAGKLPAAFDYGTEMALQRGSVASDAVHAWAGHGVVGRTFPHVGGKPRLFTEYNYASGDSDSKDGIRGTFDQLYPTGHDKLGLADQVGWQNIEHLRGGVELKPKAQWSLAGSYHSWWLASATDALYSAGGAVVTRSANGSAGRYVGQELDAQATYTYSPQLQIGGGYARVIPGEVLKATTPGRAYNYSYLMVTYVFVGDKPPTGGGRQPR
jgi:hypothetical protein